MIHSQLAACASSAQVLALIDDKAAEIKAFVGEIVKALPRPASIECAKKCVGGGSETNFLRVVALAAAHHLIPASFSSRRHPSSVAFRPPWRSLHGQRYLGARQVVRLKFVCPRTAHALSIESREWSLWLKVGPRAMRAPAPLPRSNSAATAPCSSSRSRSRRLAPRSVRPFARAPPHRHVSGSRRRSEPRVWHAASVLVATDG